MINMKLNNSILVGIIFLLIITVSCNRYIDKVKKETKTTIMQGDLVFYPDSNILIYRSNVGLKAGQEVYQPKSFKVEIPKKLKHYFISNSQNFSFVYDDDQIVSISIDLVNPGNTLEKIYQPSEEEIKKYIQKNSNIDDSKFNIANIEYLSNRRHQMINRGSASILLYNIKEENMVGFTNALKRFEFLTQN